MDRSDYPAGASSLRWAAFGQRAIGGRVPLHGSFALTHRCNLRCVHCYLGAERHAAASASGEPDTRFWLDLLDQAAEAGCLYLLLTGGEPLLRPDFAEIYTHAAERGMLVTVFTNATLVDEAILKVLTELPPQLVEISLYGASEQVFESVTGVSGSFDRCLRGVDALLGAGIRVGLKSMIMKGNLHEIQEMRAMASARGTSFRLDPALFPCWDGDTVPLEHRIPAAQAVEIEMQDLELRRRAAQYYEKARSMPADERLFGCFAGHTSFHVSPTGLLLPCLMVDAPGFDVRRGSFLEGWNGVIAQFREQGLVPEYECHRCEKRAICGVCPAQFRLETGSQYRKAEYTCQLGEERHRVLSGYSEPRASQEED
jgi:radical SAM protein with 4Fe4S-binding SPASM domain